MARILPMATGELAFLWILPREGNATTAAVDMKITRNKIDMELRKAWERLHTEDIYF